MALGAGLDADLMLVTGCQPGDMIDPDVYRRLVADLHANGKRALADLTGPPLHAALEGGVELVRLNDEELVLEGFAANDALPELVQGARRLRAAGARNVIVSRAAEPALLIADGEHSFELAGPAFESLDRHGTGDSMLAATGVGLARGMSMIEALRLGMAAGALNATRRGLGTGTREEIERLATHVRIRHSLPAVEAPHSPFGLRRRVSGFLRRIVPTDRGRRGRVLVKEVAGGSEECKDDEGLARRERLKAPARTRSNVCRTRSTRPRQRSRTCAPK